MLIPDLIFLACVLALATWRLIAPAWRPRLRLAGVGMGLLLAAVQWLLCGFTWQNLPAYLLLVLSALPLLRTGVVLRWIGRLGLLGIVAAAIGIWIMPAVPTLPQPDGRYAVGTQVFRWTDASRDEPHTADPHDHRSVIAQVWYPATAGSNPGGTTRLPYMDGIGHLPGPISGLPAFLFRRYNQIDTHAEALAPLAPNSRPWPVVIFSPGFGAPRAFYSGLATRLASLGFAVFVLDHPFEASVTQLPNGRVVGTREPAMSDPGRIHYMPDQQVVRAADIRFVIDQLARPPALATLRGGNIDGTKVAVIGHSFGGAVSALALSEDQRVVAAANIDGTPYGDLPDRKLTRPFLLLQSDLAESPHGDLFKTGNARLLATTTAPGFRYEIKHANHFSFTDGPFFFAAPGRWLLAQLMGGGRGPTATQQVTADILAAFLSGPLTGKQADLAATVARYPGVIGGPVKPGPDALDEGSGATSKPSDNHRPR